MMKQATISAPARNSGTGPKQARAELTRSAVLAAARKIFAEIGYHAAGITEIVERAAVTRGGLYYHFTEKRQLFEEVFRQISHEKFREIVDAVEPIAQDPWLHFVEALKCTLRRIASDPEMQRIVLIDGPAVLGWQRWNELQEERKVEATAAELARMMECGIVKPLNPGIAAHLILVAINEASLTIAHASDPVATLNQTIDALEALVGGLKA